MKINNSLTLNDAIEGYISGRASLSAICRNSLITNEELLTTLHNLGYFYAKPGAKGITVRKLKEASEKYIELGFGNTTVAKIAKEFQISPKNLSEHLQEYYPNIKIFGKVNFNENIFDCIDTEEKSYWLGFIFADGTISSSPLREEAKTQYQIELSLSSKDLLHLEKFKAFIELKSEIYVDDTRCRLNVYSKHLWQVLNCNGCTPQKSLTLKFPKKELFQDQSLIIHLIRGYWDGDGCLTYSNKEHTIAEISVLGTDNMLNNIQKYISNDIYKLRINHPDKQSIIKYFNVTGIKAFEITHKLYSTASIYLERKYQKFIEYCRLYEESYRVLQTNIGESWNANPEISIESKESIPS